MPHGTRPPADRAGERGATRLRRGATNIWGFGGHVGASMSIKEPPMELQGRVAIVTGAGRGIGRATALELARMGADVVVAELDTDGADKTAALVKDAGRRA